jgi:hypothetical protein
MLGRKEVRPLPLPAALVAALTFVLSCPAQISRVAGAVQASVVDQTGGAVAGAKVTVRNLSTGQTRTIPTNAEGAFYAGKLSVGRYQVRVESPGFSRYVNDAIVMSIGRVVRITARLTPATVEEKVTVSEQPPPIDPARTAEATTIGHDRIEESPR